MVCSSSEYTCKVYTGSVRRCLIYSSETWPVKVDHEAKLHGNEMNMLRWMCGFNLKDNKKNTEVRELLRLDLVSLTIKRSRLQWFGHECKDDADWLKRCMMMEFEGTWKD